jgi:D-alanyl-D-alanine carboxypeptidase (penicillin-binding protein 5/6)
MAQDGSLVKVQAGERISEYQMLQAVLLPSANNIADSLAIWAFGSLKDYSAAANQYLRDQGLVESHVGSDASGLNPSTTSSPRDLVRIGELVMQDPVLSKIVNQPNASGIPVVNNIKNVNFLLGTNNIIGIKTGNSDQAGGVFVSASRVTINNKPVTIVTALAGSPTLFQALKDSLALIQSAQKNFKPVTVVEPGSIVGNYRQPWGGSVPAIATKALSINAWSGSTVAAKVNLHDIPANSKAGQMVGEVNIPQSAISYKISAPAKLKTTPSTPSIGWRLTHPLSH